MYEHTGQLVLYRARLECRGCMLFFVGDATATAVVAHFIYV